MSKAWAVVDRKKRVIKMEPVSKALAIFDAREAARRVQKVTNGTLVRAVKLQSLGSDDA